MDGTVHRWRGGGRRASGEEDGREAQPVRHSAGGAPGAPRQRNTPRHRGAVANVTKSGGLALRFGRFAGQVRAHLVGLLLEVGDGDL